MSGYVFTLGGAAISWRSVKQFCITDSTMKAEYVAASEATKEVIWLRKFLMELEVVPSVERPLVPYYDNTAAIAQTKEPHYHSKGKHIEQKFHLIQEIVQWKEVEVFKIASMENLVDPFTKILMENIFTNHLEEMGVRLR